MLFRKKETKKTQDCKIQFKAKHQANNSRERKSVKREKKDLTFGCKTIKPPRGKRNLRAEKVKKIKRRNTILGIVAIFLILFLSIFLVFTIINFITGIRGGTSVEDVFYERQYVQGIDSVPIYPNSVFVYQEQKNEEIVMSMLNQGLSVYRLPRNTRTSDVYDYYKENLPQSSWEYISTMPVSTEEELLGQYWFKGEKGLRIHVENNDVWYELITKDEAQNALAERREAELQRKRILETSTEQNLLPNYPWTLSIPREYLISYSSTEFEYLESVKISELAGDAVFYIYPIGKPDSYYDLLNKFVEEKDEESEKTWDIISSTNSFKKDREVLMAKITVDGNSGEAIIMANKMNFMIYAIITNEEGHPFFEQIIEEIKEP